MRGIDGVTINRTAFPLAKPMRNGTRVISTMYTVLVAIHAGDQSGLGYSFAVDESDITAVHDSTIALAGPLVGGDADDPRALAQHLRESAGADHSELTIMAVSCLDTALWDLWAQVRGKPIGQLLGGTPGSQPMYGSGGSLGLSLTELVEEALHFQNSGYAGYKFKVGSADLETDVERVFTVREQLRPGFMLAVDANEAWSLEEAARACTRLEAAGLTWVEEPLVATDIAGLAELHRRSPIPLAAGESLSSMEQLTSLMREDAVDILQPDLMMCGGVTGLLEIAAIANEYHVPVAPHLFTDFNAHLISAMPTGKIVEHLDGWFEHLFVAGPDKSTGAIAPTGNPGFGLEIDRETLRRYGTSREV